jgi:hypothetical protein
VVENVFLCICAYFQTTRIKSLKIFFLTSGVVQNVFFNAFAHTFRPPESSHWKIIFFTSGVVKTCFDAFPDHQNQVLQKLFFTSGVVKNVFLCILSYFQTTRIK